MTIGNWHGDKFVPSKGYTEQLAEKDAEIERLRDERDEAIKHIERLRAALADIRDIVHERSEGVVMAAVSAHRIAEAALTHEQSAPAARPACNGNCRFPKCRGVGGHPDECYW